MKTKHTIKTRESEVTKEQDKFFGVEFEYYFNNVRRSNQRAASYAWRETVKAFPELRGVK